MPQSAKRILIAPLDWGLGHTTRCIPIIHAIHALGHKVIFAGNEHQQAFIRQSFPDIDVRLLEGYRVRYSRRALMFTLLWQIPRLLNLIRAENRWLSRLVEREEIHGIISDNRYGLWHPEIDSVVLTHQPGVLTGFGKWADVIVRHLHYRYLHRFNHVWIPDIPGSPSLAGRLSHPDVLPKQAEYVGWLSQFNPRRRSSETGHHILVLLSGPEPQRTMLADKIWAQASALQRPIVFVEGRAGAERRIIPSHIRHIKLAAAATLQPLIEQASLVICRSGYSTLMDLARLGKRAVLIPTPGQTEQEYLANYLSGQGIFLAAKQDHFSLANAIQKAENSERNWPLPQEQADLLTPVLDQWLSTL